MIDRYIGKWSASGSASEKMMRMLSQGRPEELYPSETVSNEGSRLECQNPAVLGKHDEGPQHPDATGLWTTYLNNEHIVCA